MFRLFSGVVLLFALFAGACQAAEDDDGEEAQEQEQRILTADDIPARIAQAEVGEWVLYKTGEGNRSRLTVVEKWEEHGDVYLIIQNEITRPKKKRPIVREERICVSDAVKEVRDLGPEDRVTESEVLVHGRRIDAVVVNFIKDGRVYRQSYFSEKIPVYGLVRGVNPRSKVKNALTIVDYGFAEDF